jgi:MurNAc alpha-1-phosphate uridylyltransferase
VAVERFSLNRIYDAAIAAGRLYGLVHDGAWFHLSTPADVEQTEAVLRAGMPMTLF